MNKGKIIVAHNAEQFQKGKKLMLEYAETLGFSLCFQNFDKELDNLDTIYAPPKGILLLLEDEQKQSKGCVGIKYIAEDTCELKRLYIQDTLKGHGWGKKLLHEAFKYAQQLGYKKMVLDTLPIMKTAIALYEKAGFKPIAPYYKNPVEGALFFEKALAEPILINSTIQDIDMIFEMYDKAIAYQKTVFNKQWLGFERDLIETEIRENRQLKIVIGDAVACIFAIAFNDAVIWKEKDKRPSIYIHRIVTNPNFRGAGFVKTIIDWAKEYCLLNGKDYIRLDTWGDNPKLIDYYVKCGFNYVETINLDNTAGLPIHYKGTLALFEIGVQ